MKHSGVNKKTNSTDRDIGQFFVILAVLLLVSALFYDNKQGQKNSSSTKTLSAEESEELVQRVSRELNKEIKDSQLKQEIHKQMMKIEAESSQKISTDDSAIDGVQNGEILPFSLEQDHSSQNAYKDTQYKKQKTRPLTPEQRIEAKLEKEEWLRQEQKKREDEYVRQFLENAKKSGIKVRLNQNLDVTGLQAAPLEEPIRVPNALPNEAK